MQSALRSAQFSVPVSDLAFLAESWVLDARSRQLSPQTVDAFRITSEKFLWWLQQEGHTTCGANQVRGFLSYVGAPPPPGGRWGNPQKTKPNRPRTVHTYWERLRTFFRWAVSEGLIEQSPMETIKPPVARRDQVRPFTEVQVTELLGACRRSKFQTRDEAICLLLIDTAMRNSELCKLRMRDLDLQGRNVWIAEGKGKKGRTVYFCDATAKALWRYLRGNERKPDDPVFVTERGDAFTPSGLRQMVRRLGRAAGIESVRCSPHTYRHTASLWSLKEGMHPFALREMLGHTDLTMTQRYVALADADLREQHDRFSPVRRLVGAREREQD